jgi:hypothetical protein
MKSRISSVFALIVAVAACSTERRSPPPLPAPPVATPAPDHAPLATRLEGELTARPARAVQAERLTPLLALRGIHIVRSRQVLARPLGASYCASLVSERGLGASLCEFANAAAAVQGKVLSEQRFARVLPGRRLLLNGNTLLTLPRADGETRAEADVVAALFSALEPEALRAL